MEIPDGRVTIPITHTLQVAAQEETLIQAAAVATEETGEMQCLDRMETAVTVGAHQATETAAMVEMGAAMDMAATALTGVTQSGTVTVEEEVTAAQVETAFGQKGGAAELAVMVPETATAAMVVKVAMVVNTVAKAVLVGMVQETEMAAVAATVETPLAAIVLAVRVVLAEMESTRARAATAGTGGRPDLMARMGIRHSDCRPADIRA